MKWFVHILIILSLSYSVIVIYYYFNQEKIIFYPSKHVVDPPQGHDIKEVFFDTDDNVRLHAWWMEKERASGTVLFFHGNAGNLGDRIHRLSLFNRFSYNCLIIDYRGYGKSEGSIKKEDDLYLDSLAAFEYLVDDRNIKEEDILIWAKSIGTGIAVDLAQNKNIKALILESPYTSLIDLGSHHFPWLPVKYLVTYKLNSDKKIGNVVSPILIYHSRSDKIIPFKLGEELFALAGEQKQLSILRGGHNSDIIISEKQYISEFLKFNERYLQ